MQAKVRELHWSFPDDGLLDFRGRLLPTRSHIVAARAKFADGLAETELQLEGPILFAALPVPSVRGATFTLHLEYHGEPPRLEAEWPPRPAPAIAVDTEDLEELETPANKTLEGFVERRSRLSVAAHDSAPHAKPARFFYEFDYATHPQVARDSLALCSHEGNRRSREVTEAMDVLKRRLDARGLHYGRTQAAPSEASLEALSKERLEYLTRLQKAALQQHFPRPGESVELEAFEEAFLAFSNGKLRLEGHPAGGEPNGAQYFMFAECAFAAMHAGCQDWIPLLNVLVRAQRVYMQVYEPDDGWLYSNYSPSSFHEHRQFDATALAELRADFARKSTAELELEFSKNVYEAFRDDVDYRLRQNPT